jgi:hypothetical protein
MSKTAHSPETSRAGLSRRGFLEAGGLGAIGLAVGGFEAAASMTRNDRSLILLMLVGGPSQLETFDPKPDAPREIRGPFGSIATRVPGVRVNEFLPEVARRMDRLTLVRSMHHDASPIHETGCQLIQTGALCRLGEEHPHVGSVVARARGARSGMPPFVVLPTPIGKTGVGLSHGQTAGPLGPEFEPYHVDVADPSPRTRDALDLDDEPRSVREAYGRTSFGASCLRARRLVEAGVRVVTVNMFESVFNRVTWDAHGARPFSSLEDYQRELLPTFDQAFSALLDDLEGKGLFDSTLVVATGEFGRTPKLNHAGGRDHWPGVWSAVLAGAGTRGGQVIGASDAHAAEPIDRPVTPPELLATIYRGLGVEARNVAALAGIAPIAGVLA